MGGQLATGSSIYMASAGVPAADGAGLSSIKSFSQLLTSIAAMPLAGGTFTGNVLFTDNTYDIGASGATRPRTVYAGTSVITPLVNNATAALTLGNSTYGVTVPGAATFGNDVSISRSAPSSWPELKIENTYTLGDSNYAVLRIRTTGANGGDPLIILDNSGQFQWVMSVDNSDSDKFKIGPSINSTFFTLDSAGAATFSGDISMQKATQGYIRAYATDGVKNAALYHDGTNGRISTSSGYLGFQPVNGNTVLATSAVQSRLYVYDSALAKSAILTHDGTTGILTTDTGNGSMKVTSSGGNTILSAPTGYVLAVSPVDGVTNFAVVGTQSKARVYNSVTDKYSELTHDGTNGILSTNSGNLNLVPTGGTVAVTGAVTASGASTISANALALLTLKNTAANSAYVSYYADTDEVCRIGNNSDFSGVYPCGVVATSNNYATVTSGLRHAIYTGATTGTRTLKYSVDQYGNHVFVGVVGLGGSTASYPAIKASSTTLAVRLADDSADAPISCAGITASGVVTLPNNLGSGSLVFSGSTSRLRSSGNSVYLESETSIAIGCTAISDVLTFATANNTTPFARIIGYANNGKAQLALYTKSGQTVAPLLLGDSTITTLAGLSASTGILEINNGTVVASGGSYVDLKCAGITASGDISMSKTSAQGYIYAYGTGGTNYIRSYCNASHEGLIETNAAALVLFPCQGFAQVVRPGFNATLSVYDSSATKYTRLTHDGTNGILSTSSGNLNLVPTGGTVAVTGAVTATTTMKCGTYTVATLPSAGSNAYCEACVSDSNAAASGNYGATVAGGGSNKVRVFSDGTNWVIA